MQEARETAGSTTPPAAGVWGLSPQSQLPGSIRPPGSKSLAIRALLCAGLARGETRLERVPKDQDVQACLDVLKASGVSLSSSAEGLLQVTGRSPAVDQHWSAPDGLQCGESGTLARLATAIHGFCGDLEAPLRIDVSGSLKRRVSGALFDALTQSGVAIDCSAHPEGWPVILTSAAPPETVLLQGPSSSQELSALLIALAAHPGSARGRSILVMGGLPSEPYARMTASVLLQFGAKVAMTGSEWRVCGPLDAPTEALVIETDASAAAVALAAGCLQGTAMRVPGFHERSIQGDVAILEWLQAFGCRVERTQTELCAAGRPERAVDLDLSDTPDLAPVVAALAGGLSLRAGQAAPTSYLRGLDTLNGKECRRIEVLAEGLRKLGIDVEETEDSLTIGPSRGLRPGQEPRLILDPHGDHRMAFAFGLLGLVRENLWVSDSDCVAKSWGAFWKELDGAGLNAAPS